MNSVFSHYNQVITLVEAEFDRNGSCQISETVLQGYQFQPVTLLANNGMVGDVGDFRSLQAQLEQEFYIRSNLSGKILSIHFEKGVDKEARNLLRGLLDLPCV